MLTDFFIAGSDPTNITLNWAMLYMVLEPRVQKKVQEELDSVTGRARYGIGEKSFLKIKNCKKKYQSNGKELAKVTSE